MPNSPKKYKRLSMSGIDETTTSEKDNIALYLVPKERGYYLLKAGRW
jgi:hypothetical protein